MIQKFIEAEKDNATPQVAEALDCINAIITGRYTIRKITESKLVDTSTQQPVKRPEGFSIQSSIQTAHGRVPQFGTPAKQ